MSIFQTKLKSGKFVIPECLSCNHVVWPPSDYCNLCFEKVNWRKSDGIGEIIEFSKKDNMFFCLVEFEKKIRIIGSLPAHSKQPEIGNKVKLEKSGINKKNHSFNISFV